METINIKTSARDLELAAKLMKLAARTSDKDDAQDLAETIFRVIEGKSGYTMTELAATYGF